MSKKPHLFLIILLIGGILLTACGPAAETQKTEPTEEEPTAEPTEITTEEIETEPPPEPTPTATEDTSCASEKVLCIGFVTDPSGLDDKSFNDAIWQALKMAEEEYGATVNFIENFDIDQTKVNIDAFAAENYDLIVTLGDLAGQATLEAANQYPKIDFIGVGQFFDSTPENYTRLVFNQANFGYMAGVLAGLLTQTNKVGAVLGTDQMPLIVTFKENYEAGAKLVNPDVKVGWEYHPGGFDIAFNDPEFGARIAAGLIEQDVDVIFGAGGATGNGALVEAAKHEGVYCIGVDYDVWETLPEAHNCLVSSEYRLITPAVYELIEMAIDGEFPGGEYLGQVGLGPFHDFAGLISPEIIAKLLEVQLDLKDGIIEEAYP